METMASIVSLSLPEEVAEISARLGGRILAARKVRRWRQQDLATRTGYSLVTIRAVEKGDPRTGLGIYLHVLWVMGLAREIELVADPGLDRGGLSLALDAERKRVYLPRKTKDDF
jgi:transcriptional regulator with XRE-family HTH domain